MKMDMKMLSAKWRPFCPGRDELINGTLNVPSIFEHHSDDMHVSIVDLFLNPLYNGFLAGIEPCFRLAILEWYRVKLLKQIIV